MAQLHHQQLMEAMEKQLKDMQEALQKERWERELMKRAQELSQRTTQQMHVVWNDVMTNPLVIPNYQHANDIEVQLIT